MLVLTVLQGPDRGRRYEMPDDEPQLIGRSSEALNISDNTISRRHAELTPDPDSGIWYLRDLGSANGTFVNGVRVKDRKELKPGDQVRTGATLFLFGERVKPLPSRHLRPVKRDEMEVSLEHTVTSNDDSMVLSVPEPAAGAQRQLRVLLELVRLIGSVGGRDELLERVMDVIYDNLNADRGFILLVDDPREDPEPVVVRRRREDGTVERVDMMERQRRMRGESKKAPQAIPFSRTIVQYVLRKSVGVLSSNAMSDERFRSGDSVQDFHIHSAMCVPIRYQERLYGVIHLDSQVVNYTYTEDQLTLLTAIGVQTGLAISNLESLAARVRSERLAAVGQTVASLSHSIKNILQGMRGGADVVELGLRKQNMNVVSNGWEIVSRNLERIYALTLNMLAFSKQRKPELEMTVLEGVLEDVVELVRTGAEAKRVALITDHDPDMPPIPIDAGGVHQAVLNLLNNAVDAVEPESGVVTLRTQYDDERERALIAVSDNGAGMSRAVQAKLFEPFHSTKGYGGTGLGLVVAQKVVEEHGGSIGVESQRGEGTTFTISLPVRAEMVPASADTHGAGSR